MLLLALVAAAPFWMGVWGGPGDAVSTYIVQSRTLVDTVIERGTLESQNTISGECLLPGWENTIIFIVPEGSAVQAGEVVVRLEDNAIREEIARQEVALNEASSNYEQAQQELKVQENQNLSDIAAAELALELARLDLEKYRDGDFRAEVAELERSIAEGKAELERHRDRLDNLRELVRKGYREPEQLREMDQLVLSYQYRLERDLQRLDVLKTYEYRRTITELEFNATEAERNLHRVRESAVAETSRVRARVDGTRTAKELEDRKLKELQQRLEWATISAPQDGTVVYANREWWGPEDRIREGATVRRGQAIFWLPDMTKMQVKVNVHEAVVNKVKAGQRALIRVDAFPEHVFPGTVGSVATMASSDRFAATNAYEAVVKVDRFPPEIPLKPGMTAAVEIQVGTYPDVIAVPVPAVTEHLQQFYVYLRRGSGFERRRIEMGRSTNSFIEVLDGLQAGDAVALDAYHRGLEDFRDSGRDHDPLAPDELELGSELGEPVAGVAIEPESAAGHGSPATSR